MSDGEDERPGSTVEPENQIKEAKNRRSVAKRRFTRKIRLLRDAIAKGTEAAILTDLEKEVCDNLSLIEVENDKYMLLLTNLGDRDHDLEEAEEYIQALDEQRVNARCSMANQIKQIGLGDKQIKMKALQSPHFTGNIRDYPKFKDDFGRLMQRTYGKDCYVLRSCLSGEAADVVKGIDHDFDEMFKRLDNAFGDPRKLVDACIADVKNFKVLNDGDNKGFITMVEKVEHCFLDLKKMGLEREMNSTSMVSYIERVLPDRQKREWVLYSEKHKNDKDLFMLLMDFLLREKRVLEYMDADIRSSKASAKGACNSTAGQIIPEKEDSVCLAISKLTEDQSEMRVTLSSLAAAIANLNKSESSNDSRYANSMGQKCFVHESGTHTTAECFEFQKMNITDRIELLKKKGICFICLKGRHISKTCFSKKACGIMVDDQSCHKYHHPLLHEAFKEGKITSVSHFKNPSSSYACQRVLLMINKVHSNGHFLTTLWDPGSDITMITFAAAQRLGLRGKDILLTVTGIGNKTLKQLIAKNITSHLLIVKGIHGPLLLMA